MARGTKLKDALLMLKGELGISTAPATGKGSDSELMSIIDTQQKWLAGEYDWPFLRSQADVAISYGSRYGVMPPEVDFEKPVRVDAWTLENEWHQLEFGITADEYNRNSAGLIPGDQDYTTHITHWDMRPWRKDMNIPWPPVSSYPTQVFEIWPSPAADYTVRFTGKRPMVPLRGTNGFLPENPLELDDVLVVFYAAYKKLSRLKKEDASFVLAQAEKRFNSLRAAQPSRDTPIVLGGPYYHHHYRRRGIIAGNDIVTV